MIIWWRINEIINFYPFSWVQKSFVKRICPFKVFITWFLCILEFSKDKFKNFNWKPFNFKSLNLRQKNFILPPKKAHSHYHELFKMLLEFPSSLISFPFSGVFFDNRVENIKFIDFCGKYRVPFLQVKSNKSCDVPKSILKGIDFSLFSFSIYVVRGKNDMWIVSWISHTSTPIWFRNHSSDRFRQINWKNLR